MKKSRSPIEAGVLSGLGVTSAEETLYVALLARESASAAELAALLGAPKRGLEAAIRSLEGKGLVTHSPDRVRRYFAVPPDIGVTALIARRQSELGRAQSAIERLRELTSAAASARRANDRLVEVLSPEASVGALTQMVHSAEREVLCLQRLPVLVSPAGPFEEAQRQGLARGIASRGVLDGNLLRIPGMLEKLRREVAAGEQHRVHAGLPFKLFIVDRRIGMVPLELDNAAGPNLLVRSSSLLRALHELFETFWRIAVPLTFDAAGGLRIEAEGAAATADHDRLLALLASGLNDKTIEHELGISRRTFTRRVAALMKRLGAATRFHAGWLAAQAAQSRRDGAGGG